MKSLFRYKIGEKYLDNNVKDALTNTFLYISEWTPISFKDLREITLPGLKIEVNSDTNNILVKSINPDIKIYSLLESYECYSKCSIYGDNNTYVCFYIRIESLEDSLPTYLIAHNRIMENITDKQLNILYDKI